MDFAKEWSDEELADYFVVVRQLVKDKAGALTDRDWTMITSTVPRPIADMKRLRDAVGEVLISDEISAAQFVTMVKRPEESTIDASMISSSSTHSKRAQKLSTKAVEGAMFDELSRPNGRSTRRGAALRSEIPSSSTPPQGTGAEGELVGDDYELLLSFMSGATVVTGPGETTTAPTRSSSLPSSTSGQLFAREKSSASASRAGVNSASASAFMSAASSALSSTRPVGRPPGRKNKLRNEVDEIYTTSPPCESKTHVETLSRALESASLRQWCIYEWFYANIDQDWFNQNDFMSMLHSIHLKEMEYATKAQWNVVRRCFGQPRRLSAKFFSEERTKLEKHRNQVRALRLPNITGTVDDSVSSVDSIHAISTKRKDTTTKDPSHDDLMDFSQEEHGYSTMATMAETLGVSNVHGTGFIAKDKSQVIPKGTRILAWLRNHIPVRGGHVPRKTRGGTEENTEEASEEDDVLEKEAEPPSGAESDPERHTSEVQESEKPENAMDVDVPASEEGFSRYGALPTHDLVTGKVVKCKKDNTYQVHLNGQWSDGTQMIAVEDTDIMSCDVNRAVAKKRLTVKVCKVELNPLHYPTTRSQASFIDSDANSLSFMVLPQSAHFTTHDYQLAAVVFLLLDWKEVTLGELESGIVKLEQAKAEVDKLKEGTMKDDRILDEIAIQEAKMTTMTASMKPIAERLHLINEQLTYYKAKQDERFKFVASSHLAANAFFQARSSVSKISDLANDGAAAIGLSSLTAIAASQKTPEKETEVISRLENEASLAIASLGTSATSSTSMAVSGAPLVAGTPASALQGRVLTREERTNEGLKERISNAVALLKIISEEGVEPQLRREALRIALESLPQHDPSNSPVLESIRATAEAILESLTLPHPTAEG